MIEDGARCIWEVGDRVTRELYLDDGTWMAKDDRCLADSPLMRGEVTAVEREPEGDMLIVVVQWDGGRTGRYYEHGIDPEPRPTGGQRP